MFRKIRSNKPSEKTVWTDLRDELAPHFKRVYHSFSTLMKKFPRAIFTLMVMNLILSVFWSFNPDNKSVHANTDQVLAKKDSFQNAKVINAGLNTISTTAGNLRQTMAIREKVDSILNKKNLSPTDSAFLENALLELKKIQQP